MSTGYRDCTCCGLTIIAGPGKVVLCDGCDGSNGDTCDYSKTWHCYTGHCDGSGCTYYGECEGLPPGYPDRPNWRNTA